MATTPRRTPRPKPAAGKAGALPESMKAIALETFGPPGVLRLHDLPVPIPGPTEVLIELHAAGVGSWDSAVRDGSWVPVENPRFPYIPGMDGAGVVVARGSRVRRFEVGDRVWAMDYEKPQGGFYAEYVAVEASRVGSFPERLDMNQAGAAVATGLTALQGIDDALKVGCGDTVLIFGATGGVGTLAIQFARRRGARVLATASGAAGARLVKGLGAEGVFDARGLKAVESLRKLAPDGIDGALVLASNENLEACLDLVGREGLIAYPNGVSPVPRKRRGIGLMAYDAEIGTAELERLSTAAEEARLTVPLAAVYPLKRAAAAHEKLEKGHVLGRIALSIRS